MGDDSGVFVRLTTLRAPLRAPCALLPANAAPDEGAEGPRGAPRRCGMMNREPKGIAPHG